MEVVEPPFYEGSQIKVHSGYVTPHHFASIGRDETFFSASGLNPIISQINDQEDSSRLIWWV